MSILTFNAQNTKDAIEAVWWVDIHGLRLRYGTCEPSWNPTDTTSNRTIKPYMSDMIQVRPQSVEPLNGKTTSHGLTFSLLDVSDEITSLMSVHDETNKVWTWLTSSCTLSHVTLTVNDSSGFSTPCDIYLDGETMRATSAPDGTHLAVTRGMYSSTTAEHLIVDDAGQAQTVMVWNAPRFMVGRDVTLYESRSGLDEEDSVALPCVIEGINERSGIWTFSASGVLSKIGVTINRNPAWAFLGQDTGNTLLLMGGMGSFVTATAGVKEPWVWVGDNIRAYTACIDSTTAVGFQYMTSKRAPKMFGKPAMGAFVGESNMLERGEFGDEVVQCFSHVMFQDGSTKYTDPISVILCLMLSKKGDKANHATYDILPDGYGMGLDADLVNVTAFETLRDTTDLKDISLKFVIKENENAKKWIEEQILRPNMLFLIETWNGSNASISISRLLTKAEAIVAGSSLSITEDMLLDEPELDVSMMPIGEITWKLNHDPVEDEFMGIMKVIFAESIARYKGNARRFELEVKTIYDDNIGIGGRVWQTSECGSMPICLGNYIATLWDRFGVNPVPSLTVEIPYNRLTSCYPGNIVRVTCSITPDLHASTRGFTAEYFQIVELAPQPKNSCIQLKLWQIGAHDLNCARVAPSAKVKSIHDDYASGGKARVLIYKNVYAQSTGYDDRDKFIEGDKVRFFSSLMVPSDSATYTVDATGNTGSYSYIQLDEAEVDPAPSPADGAIMDTVSYDSATATQTDNWCFMSDTSRKVGTANAWGYQRKDGT